MLFLSEDPELVRRQVHGEDLEPEAAQPLRDGVSVDEIIPAWVCYYFGQRLGDFPYLGLLCRGQFPLPEGAVLRGGFQVVVSGEHHGSHGPREAAVFAEYAAGIRLVVARSFDPTYLQHCHALGMLTTTDPAVLDTLRRGDPLYLEPFTRTCSPLGAEILRSGGLFGYTMARMAGHATLPLPDRAPRPMTLAEKILARAALTSLEPETWGLPAVAPGDGLLVRADWRYSHETVTDLAATMLRSMLPDAVDFRAPERILAFRDHLAFIGEYQEGDGGQPGFLEVARRLQASQETFCAGHGIRLHGETGGAGAEGISHVIMAEHYALPGQVLFGTDPHACHSGALGALAMGVGAAEMANAWLNGDLPVTVPPTSLVRLRGRLRPEVAAKDLALHLLTLPPLRDGRVGGHVLEFQGEALESMSTDERATLTNMAPVFGALAGIVAPDAETDRFLRERRAATPAREPWMCSDPDASFAGVVEVDCTEIKPMVAAPGHPGNALPLAKLNRAVPVDIAYVGSCTGGKRDDIEAVYAVVRWALEHDVRLPLRVQMFIQMGSDAVRQYAEAQGWIAAFEEVGARVLNPGCGACIHAGPGVSTRADQVTIGAFNRNFPGRSGPGPVWLASPATVAASAFRGSICSFEQLRGGAS